MIADYANVTLVGVYETHREAESAIRLYAEAGADVARFSIIARTCETVEDVEGFYRPTSVALEGAAQGACVALVSGVTFGMAYWLLPGGWHFSTFCAALIGLVVAGAVAGSAFRAGSMLLTPADRALKYRRHIESSGYVVLCHDTVTTSSVTDRLDQSIVWPPPVFHPSDGYAGVR